MYSGRQMADDVGMDVGLDQLHRLMEHVVVDAGGDAHLAHHVQHVLGGHVAGRAGSEGAAAQAAGGGLELMHAQLHAGQGVGQGQTAGIVQVHDEALGAELLDQSFHQIIGALGVGHAHGCRRS